MASGSRCHPRRGRMFFCKFCNHPFLSQHRLETHERIHTGNKPHQCPFCYRAFTQAMYLRFHLEQIHGGSEEEAQGLVHSVASLETGRVLDATVGARHSARTQLFDGHNGMEHGMEYVAFPEDQMTLPSRFPGVLTSDDPMQHRTVNDTQQDSSPNILTRTGHLEMYNNCKHGHSSKTVERPRTQSVDNPTREVSSNHLVGSIMEFAPLFLAEDINVPVSSTPQTKSSMRIITSDDNTSLPSNSLPPNLNQINQPQIKAESISPSVTAKRKADSDPTRAATPRKVRKQQTPQKTVFDVNYGRVILFTEESDNQEENLDEESSQEKYLISAHKTGTMASSSSYPILSSTTTTTKIKKELAPHSTSLKLPDYTSIEIKKELNPDISQLALPNTNKISRNAFAKHSTSVVPPGTTTIKVHKEFAQPSTSGILPGITNTLIKKEFALHSSSRTDICNSKDHQGFSPHSISQKFHDNTKTQKGFAKDSTHEDHLRTTTTNFRKSLPQPSPLKDDPDIVCPMPSSCLISSPQEVVDSKHSAAGKALNLADTAEKDHLLTCQSDIYVDEVSLPINHSGTILRNLLDTSNTEKSDCNQSDDAVIQRKKKVLTCDLCGKAFTGTLFLRSHFRVAHGAEIIGIESDDDDDCNVLENGGKTPESDDMSNLAGSQNSLEYEVIPKSESLCTDSLKGIKSEYIEGSVDKFSDSIDISNTAEMRKVDTAFEIPSSRKSDEFEVVQKVEKRGRGRPKGSKTKHNGLIEEFTEQQIGNDWGNIKDVNCQNMESIHIKQRRKRGRPLKPTVLIDYSGADQEGVNTAAGNVRDVPSPGSITNSVMNPVIVEPVNSFNEDHEPDFESLIQNENVGLVSGKRLACTMCGKLFSQLRRLQIHVQLHKKRKFGCMVCLKKFTRKSDVKRHLRNFHPQDYETFMLEGSHSLAIPEENPEPVHRNPSSCQELPSQVGLYRKYSPATPALDLTDTVQDDEHASSCQIVSSDAEMSFQTEHTGATRSHLLSPPDVVDNDYDGVDDTATPPEEKVSTCELCKESFTNAALLWSHFREKHGVELVGLKSDCGPTTDVEESMQAVAAHELALPCKVEEEETIPNGKEQLRIGLIESKVKFESGLINELTVPIDSLNADEGSRMGATCAAGISKMLGEYEMVPEQEKRGRGRPKGSKTKRRNSEEELFYDTRSTCNNRNNRVPSHDSFECRDNFPQEQHKRGKYSKQKIKFSNEDLEPLIEKSVKKNGQYNTGGSYQCGLCQKVFLKKNDLVRHIRTHTGEQPFLCSTCGQQFTDLAHLRSHEQLHHISKRYACDICGMRFAQSGGLYSHSRTHEKKQFGCRVCSKKFTRKSDVQRHIRTVHWYLNVNETKS